MVASLKNHFLIAMPSLTDPFFYHAVVYLCQHSDQGAMGLIINRPTQIMLDALLEHVQISCDAPSAKTVPILFGGPVGKNQGMVLHDDSKGGWTNSIDVADDIVLTSSTDILQAIASEQGPQNKLIALGYSGWGGGQLEQELAENSWLTSPADKEILFSSPSKECWKKAAALIGVDMSLLSGDIGHA